MLEWKTKGAEAQILSPIFFEGGGGGGGPGGGGRKLGGGGKRGWGRALANSLP